MSITRTWNLSRNFAHSKQNPRGKTFQRSVKTISIQGPLLFKTFKFRTQMETSPNWQFSIGKSKSIDLEVGSEILIIDL